MALGYANIVWAVGLLLGAIAVSLLIWMRFRSRRDIWPSVSRPLIDVSIVAVILSSVPLLLVRACLPAAG
jgi:hypothetical protein